MIYSLALFVFLGLFSPGPNVIMLTASGARFGFRATLPHIFGVALGTGIIAICAGLGIGAFLKSYPSMTFALKVLACGWILYMAYNLLRHGSVTAQSDPRPFNFVQAVLFQWVNPKIWSVALAASTYVTSQIILHGALILGATFLTLNIMVCIFWTATGNLLSTLLDSPNAWKWFRCIMAIALALSGFLVFLD